jgi:hypothetical protein
MSLPSWEMTKLFMQTNGGSMNSNQWSKAWGDNFPTEKECPIEVIEHHAQANNLLVSDELISFARAMWNEGNLS